MPNSALDRRDGRKERPNEADVLAPIVLAISEIDGGYSAQVECWRTGSPDELKQDEILVQGTACRMERIEAANDSAIKSGDPIRVVLRTVDGRPVV
jgi:hypothetical protein